MPRTVVTAESIFAEIQKTVADRVQAAVREAADAAYADLMAKLPMEYAGLVRLTMLHLPFKPEYELRIVFGAPPPPPETV